MVAASRRVAVVSSTHGHAMGGAERQAERLAERLAEEGLQVTLLTRGGVARHSWSTDRVIDRDWAAPVAGTSSAHLSTGLLERLPATLRRRAGRRRRSTADRWSPLIVVLVRWLRHLRTLEERPARGRAIATMERLLVRIARRVVGGKGRAMRGALDGVSAHCIVAFLHLPSLLAALAVWDRDVRFVPSFRNDPDREDREEPWRSLQYLVVRRADVVTANSRSALDALARRPEARDIPMILVPNIVDTVSAGHSDVMRPDASSLTAGKGSRTFLVVGRLARQKRVDVAIEAFKLTGLAEVGWVLKVVGDGSLRHELLELRDRVGLADSVEFLGHVADVPRYMRETGGVLLLPSEYEGTPNVILEAMRAGMVCIVNDCSAGPVEALMGDGPPAGVVVPCGTGPEGFAEAILRLAADPEHRRQLASAGAQRADRYLWSTVRRSWLRAIDASHE